MIRAPNHLLRIALSPNAVEYPNEGSGAQPFVAFSGSLHQGNISLFKTRQEPRSVEKDVTKAIDTESSTPPGQRETRMFEQTICEDFPLSAIKFNKTGELMATSSANDTTISVFRISNALKKADDFELVTQLTVAKSLSKRQLRSIVDFTFEPISSRYVAVLIKPDGPDSPMIVEVFDLSSLVPTNKVKELDRFKANLASEMKFVEQKTKAINDENEAPNLKNDLPIEPEMKFAKSQPVVTKEKDFWDALIAPFKELIQHQKNILPILSINLKSSKLKQPSVSKKTHVQPRCLIQVEERISDASDNFSR